MTNKSKATTVARKQARAVKASPVVQAPVKASKASVPVVSVTPDTIVNVAPKGTKTIVQIAREHNLAPKNARRILRDMKAKGTLPEYDHTKGNRHYLTPVQEQAYVARIMSRRDA